MFLFERLFGIGTYMLILSLVCFLLEKTNISCRSILRFYLLCLCCMAFFYKPYKTADLYRIYEQMNSFSSINFNSFWKEFAVESSIPIARLMYWFFSKIGINELLPAFSAFFCYSLIFYIIRKTKQIYDISNQTVATVLFFIMTTSMYISVIGGIRMMIALAMITFGYFRMTVEKKIRIIDILFLIASIFIHAMSLVAIGICTVALLFDSDKSIAKKIGYALIVLTAGGIFVTKFSNTVRGVYEKFLVYIMGAKHSDPWEYLMGFFIIITLLLILLETRYIQKTDKYLGVNKSNIAAGLCIVLAIAFCSEFSIFYRFGGHLAVMFAIPAMMVSIEKTKGQSSLLFKGVSLRSVVILLSCIIAVISCTRGSLSSLKFFEL